jgi:hypothetical protein
MPESLLASAVRSVCPDRAAVLLLELEKLREKQYKNIMD